MNEVKYSVLMSVYHKEKPENLEESIESMLNQTIKPNEIVLVKDGVLTSELEQIISKYKDDPVFNIISLSENVGLGKALNLGLLKCSNEVVARMDTDDVSEKNRCEKQLKIILGSNVSVVGSSVREFVSCKGNVVAYKTVLENHKDIRKRMKYRNPINHPTVMFKKSDVLSAGSYQDWYLNEDYYLWVRMILSGFNFVNINEPLVSMRITSHTYQRRGGWSYFISQKRLFKKMLEMKFINHIEYFYNNLIRFIIRVLLPNKLREIVYLKLLRINTEK